MNLNKIKKFIRKVSVFGFFVIGLTLLDLALDVSQPLQGLLALGGLAALIYAVTEAIAMTFIPNGGN